MRTIAEYPHKEALSTKYPVKFSFARDYLPVAQIPYSRLGRQHPYDGTSAFMPLKWKEAWLDRVSPAILLITVDSDRNENSEYR